MGDDARVRENFAGAALTGHGGGLAGSFDLGVVSRLLRGEFVAMAVTAKHGGPHVVRLLVAVLVDRLGRVNSFFLLLVTRCIFLFPTFYFSETPFSISRQCGWKKPHAVLGIDPYFGSYPVAQPS